MEGPRGLPGRAGRQECCGKPGSAAPPLLCTRAFSPRDLPPPHLSFTGASSSRIPSTRWLRGPPALRMSAFSGRELSDLAGLTTEQLREAVPGGVCLMGSLGAHSTSWFITSDRRQRAAGPGPVPRARIMMLRLVFHTLWTETC